MSQSWTPEEQQNAEKEALRRSATDPTFRALILKDPKSAVQEITGKPLPEKVKIRVLERAGYDATFVLPDATSAQGELSDAELEQVAGGRGVCGVSCGIGTNM